MRNVKTEPEPSSGYKNHSFIPSSLFIFRSNFCPVSSKNLIWEPFLTFNRIGNKLFIKGNIDSVHTLLNGSDDKIYKDVSERIKIGMQNPGFILSTACSIAPKVKKENIQVLAKIAKKVGVYHNE